MTQESSHRGWTPPKSWPLRTRLVLLTMALLTAISTVIGVVVVAIMSQVLTDDVDTQLRQASHRASSYDPRAVTDPTDVRGQAAGTITARLHGSVMNIAVLIDNNGKKVKLDDRDATTLATLATSPSFYSPAGPVVERELSLGTYRLVGTQAPNGDVIINGLPLGARDATLQVLVLTIVVVTLAALLLCLILGSWVIRRTMKPLATLSSLAGRVADAELDKDDVVLNVRVPREAADPETEVGSVGHAFNRMLENVSHGFDVRRESEMRAKQFVADASHELRTPLTAIRGYSEMLGMTEQLSELGRENLSRVQSQAVRMNGLVEDLLTLARLDEGQSVRGQNVDLGELAVEELTEKQAQDSTHKWVLDVPAEPVMVWAEPARLRQVLVNLLTNAQKHTPSGTRISLKVDYSLTGQARMTVTDNGPGIPAELQPNVFSRFTKADKARTGGSTGLGLSIAQSIVHAHGGSIELESFPGKTEFSIYLPPLEPAGRGHVPPMPQAPPAGVSSQQ